MRLLDLTLDTPAENLALDEALLLRAEAGDGPEVLRLWEWPAAAVVLGSGCRIAEEVHEEACRADGVPVFRRSSGGGTVLLGPGCLLFSLILRQDRHPALGEILPSYAYILGRVAEALGGPIQQAGISDLCREGRKFSGNAQQRKRTHLLHHGTLLHAFSFAPVARYLPPPPRPPEYRAGRGHDAFLGNLPLTAAELRERLVRTWEAGEPSEDWPREEVARLVAEKYAREAWTRRR